MDPDTQAEGHGLPHSIVPQKPANISLFRPPEEEPTMRALAKDIDALSLRIMHRRQQTLESWLVETLVKELPELNGLPELDFVAKAHEAGYYVVQPELPGDDAMTTRAILYRRREGQPDEVVSSMTFQATMDGDKDSQRP